VAAVPEVFPAAYGGDPGVPVPPLMRE
jgi:hypothetical protein